MDDTFCRSRTARHGWAPSDICANGKTFTENTAKILTEDWMYNFTSKIRYSETDAYGRLTPEKLIDYFQDCSTFQSEDAGIGVKKLQERGLAWIIVYWRVEFCRMPVLGEEVRIGTVPYQMKGGIGLRNFLMETADGEKLAVANSVWTLVDTVNMHPVRIPADVLEKYPLGERLDMKYDSRKIRIPDLPCETKTPIEVQEYHLDTNRHMNNGQYVRIAEGLLPAEKEAAVLRIEYRQQAVLGDRITPVVYAADSSSACVSLNADDGKPYAIMEVHFSQSK